MIKRLDEWFYMTPKSAIGLFMAPIIAGGAIIGKTYWLAALTLLGFLMSVYSLWHYVTTVPEPEDEEAKLTKLCVEKDAFGNKHYLIRNYDENGEIVDSTDEVEGKHEKY